jgi:4-hydroxy-tetrahydrodipicolinate reductase
MIRVAVSGAAGRMGTLVCQAVAEADDLDLIVAYDPSHAGETVAGITVTDDTDAVGGADVVVEFTVPTIMLDNLARWRALEVHTVVGTSGFDEERLAELRRRWGSGPPNCLVVPNFSIGAVLMMRFAEEASSHLRDAEIVEMHHQDKVDAPSGTAIATADRMGRSTGGDPPEIHSVRLPGIVSRQDVIFGGVGETLTISHETTDRRSFMPGVLIAVRGVAGLPAPVTVGLEAVL